VALLLARQGLPKILFFVFLVFALVVISIRAAVARFLSRRLDGPDASATARAQLGGLHWLGDMSLKSPPQAPGRTSCREGVGGFTATAGRSWLEFTHSSEATPKAILHQASQCPKRAHRAGVFCTAFKGSCGPLPTAVTSAPNWRSIICIRFTAVRVVFDEQRSRSR